MASDPTLAAIMVDLLKTSGALAGFAAFAMNWSNARRAYLQQKIAVRDEDDATFLFVDLEVQNSSPWPKQLEHAFLIVSPYAETLVSSDEADESTGNTLADAFNHGGAVSVLPPRYTNDLESFPQDQPVVLPSRAYIPLPFFFRENIRVSDETLYYTAALDKQYFEPNQVYAIRFFITDRKRLHRSVHTAFQISGNAGGAHPKATKDQVE